MVQAARLSTQLGLASAADHDRLRTLLVDLGLPVDPPALPVERLEHHMALDKKASRSGLRFVLWRGIGEAFIATDVPGCRNVVDHGVNGYLCEVKDAEDLARAMTAMIELPAADRAAMGQASRHKIETEFDERLVVDCYLEVIRDALVGCGEAKRV